MGDEVGGLRGWCFRDFRGAKGDYWGDGAVLSRSERGLLG